MAATIGAAIGVGTTLVGCSTMQDPYLYQNGNSLQSNSLIRSVLSSAQNATAYNSGSAVPTFQADRFMRNLTRNLENQMVGNTRYSSPYRRQYNPSYNPYYQGMNNSRQSDPYSVYNPNPSHREAYLQRRAASRAQARSQYLAQQGYNGYPNEPLYRRLPNGRFVPIE
jgi:hypothetical protein